MKNKIEKIKDIKYKRYWNEIDKEDWKKNYFSAGVTNPTYTSDSHPNDGSGDC